MSKQTFPDQVTKYFWGDDLGQLNWLHHKKYIIQTLLEKGDVDAIAWLFQQSDKKEIKKMLPSLKLSQKSANFWNIYLS